LGSVSAWTQVEQHLRCGKRTAGWDKFIGVSQPVAADGELRGPPLNRRVGRLRKLPMLSKFFQRRAAKKQLALAKSEFDVAASAFVAANRAARASGKMLTPEMEAAGEQLERAQERLMLAKSSLDRATDGPQPVALTETVSRKVRSLFPAAQYSDVIHLLEKECARNLPLHEDADPQKLERVRLAVVKLSGGNLAEMRNQVDVAKRDWRDVLAIAEEPEAFKIGLVALSKLDAEARAALNARDQKQYDDWLRNDSV